MAAKKASSPAVEVPTFTALESSTWVPPEVMPLAPSPLSSLMPLNWVRPATLLISSRSSLISIARYSRCCELRVSVAPWVASSFMRVSMFCTASMPDSAVWIMEIPSLALRTA